MADNGLVAVKSSHGVGDTIDKLAAIVAARGMQIFARVDHGKGANEAGLALRSTVLLIFGNARGGTPLMQQKQAIGIDLPLKALVWQDDAQRTWLSYNDLGFLVERHQACGITSSTLAAMSAILGEVAREAAGGDSL